MIVIEYLSDKIEDEIDDASDYSKNAIAYKDMYPWLGEILYTISLDETKHRQMLHDAVVRLIKEYREKVGEPPADMMARYDYLHKKHIQNAAESKTLQSMYREG